MRVALKISFINFVLNMMENYTFFTSLWVYYRNCLNFREIPLIRWSLRGSNIKYFIKICNRLMIEEAIINFLSTLKLEMYFILTLLYSFHFKISYSITKLRLNNSHYFIWFSYLVLYPQIPTIICSCLPLSEI